MHWQQIKKGNKKENLPGQSTRLHLIGELNVTTVHIELPLPLTKNAGQYATSVHP